MPTANPARCGSTTAAVWNSPHTARLTLRWRKACRQHASISTGPFKQPTRDVLPPAARVRHEDSQHWHLHAQAVQSCPWTSVSDSHSKSDCLSSFIPAPCEKLPSTTQHGIVPRATGCRFDLGLLVLLRKDNPFPTAHQSSFRVWCLTGVRRFWRLAGSRMEGSSWPLQTSMEPSLKCNSI